MPDIRTSAAVLACATLFAATASPADPAPISDGVVKIGVLTDMSSIFSDIGGKGSVVAAQMAVDDFGGKVLGGHPAAKPLADQAHAGRGKGHAHVHGRAVRAHGTWCHRGPRFPSSLYGSGRSFPRIAVLKRVSVGR